MRHLRPHFFFPMESLGSVWPRKKAVWETQQKAHPQGVGNHALLLEFIVSKEICLGGLAAAGKTQSSQAQAHQSERRRFGHTVGGWLKYLSGRTLNAYSESVPVLVAKAVPANCVKCAREPDRPVRLARTQQLVFEITAAEIDNAL